MFPVEVIGLRLRVVMENNYQSKNIDDVKVLMSLDERNGREVKSQPRLDVCNLRASLWQCEVVRVSILRLQVIAWEKSAPF